MFKKAINFIKYNNATVLILAIALLVGTGAFAQTETGQEIIGEREISIEGIDNTLLLEADLNSLDMDFKIEHIEEDGKYYYVTYTFLDIAKKNDAWQYQVQEKIRKVSKKLKKDLGLYLSEELHEQYEARIKELTQEKERVEEIGEETRTEVVAYSGLIGGTLDLVSKVFTGYEPVKVREIPSPTVPPTILLASATEESSAVTADSLTEVYNDYIDRMDPDRDDVFGVLDNCPEIANTNQIDTDNDGLGDVCDPDPLTPAAAVTETTEEVVPADEETVPEEGTTEETGTTTEETLVEELIDEIINDTTEEPATEPEETPADTTDDEPATEESTETEGEPDVEIIDLPVEEPESEPEPEPEPEPETNIIIEESSE